jgi:hypothetical protein
VSKRSERAREAREVMAEIKALSKEMNETSERLAALLEQGDDDTDEPAEAAVV